MKIDQKEVRSALVAAFEADKSRSILSTPSDEAIEIVRFALAAQHDLRDISITNGQMSNRFVLWAAPTLLRRAHYSAGIDGALAWLDRILQIRQSDYYIVMPLWGLKLEESLDLTEQIRLLPATEFSQSNNLSQFLRPVSGTLDTLLGDGAGELVFKVGLRAALLIGGNLSDRQRRRAIVKSAYDLRSKVVHTGQADKTLKFKGQIMPTKDFVELAIGVTAEVVRKIILLGKIPDWNDVELSGHV